MWVESGAKGTARALSAARERIISYMERRDLDAIDSAEAGGFPVLRRIARNATEKAGKTARLPYTVDDNKEETKERVVVFRPNGRR